MAYFFRKTIWAVGQGGFSMGTLYEETAPKTRLFTYVYDCGSDQLDALRREVDSAKLHFEANDEMRIETVFISHLDADHVNGFDTLCEFFDRQIDRVILPYLDFESRYYLAARAIADRNATGLFLEFVADPVRWVRSRLPNAQIHLLGPQPGDEPDAPMPTPDSPDGGSKNRTRRAAADGKATLVIEHSKSFKTSYANIQQYRWMSLGVSTAGVTNSPILLLAHVPPRSTAKLAEFRKKLIAAGFRRLSAVGLRAILADSLKREALRTCFLELASDHNIISIHLLVKSIGNANLEDDSRNKLRCMVWPSVICNGVGFLFSGDAKLSTKKYFNHWKNFYDPHLNDVKLFSLPHHGSILSFDAQLLNVMPNANFIAQAGTNGHGHPSTVIIQQIEGLNRGFHKVDGSTHNRIDVVYKIS